MKQDSWYVHSIFSGLAITCLLLQTMVMRSSVEPAGGMECFCAVTSAQQRTTSVALAMVRPLARREALV
jgi:hypothetical protein